MKKRISLLLVLLLLVSALTPAALAADDADTTEAVPAAPEQLAAEALSTIGVFRGTGNGFALDRAPTRLGGGGTDRF